MFDDNFLNLSGVNGIDGNASLFDLDTNSIIGKNKVLNFIGRIDYEISFLKFSDTANIIAEFYESLKSNKGLKGIDMFLDNSVIKMIIKEMDNYPKVKEYLNERIFELIEEDRLNTLEKWFKDSDKIFKRQKNKQEKGKSKKAKKEDYKKEIVLKINDLLGDNVVDINDIKDTQNENNNNDNDFTIFSLDDTDEKNGDSNDDNGSDDFLNF